MAVRTDGPHALSARARREQSGVPAGGTILVTVTFEWSSFAASLTIATSNLNNKRSTMRSTVHCAYKQKRGYLVYARL